MEDESYEENEAVIIKAVFGNYIVKYALDIPLTMDELKERIARSYKIEVGSFQLKYLDGEGNWILLGHDDDLQSSINNLKELGQTTLRVLVFDYPGWHWTMRARTIGEKKDRALKESNMNQQDLPSEVENKNNIINQLNKMRLEEAQEMDWDI